MLDRPLRCWRERSNTGLRHSLLPLLSFGSGRTAASRAAHRQRSCHRHTSRERERLCNRDFAFLMLRGPADMSASPAPRVDSHWNYLLPKCERALHPSSAPARESDVAHSGFATTNTVHPHNASRRRAPLLRPWPMSDLESL